MRRREEEREGNNRVARQYVTSRNLMTRIVTMDKVMMDAHTGSYIWLLKIDLNPAPRRVIDLNPAPRRVIVPSDNLLGSDHEELEIENQ